MNNFSQEVYDLIDDLDFGDDCDDYDWPQSGPGGPRGPGGPVGPRGPGGPYGPGSPCGPGGRGGPGGPGAGNNLYNNAFGNYCGGYGPGGGFATRRDPRGPPGPPCPPPPPDFFGPPGPPCPPRRLGPPGPPGPLGPPPEAAMWGRGFGPSGPLLARNASPDVRAFRYQLRCGVSKDVVKTLPKQMLVMMEPEYCGLCAIEFDSYTMSRLHYTSRNHSKNQRKWISQSSEFGGKKELPLKSRDLYCELCDVHITSKNHAESHYAGKPHRAILFGRKKPKNPYLLQRGLEARIEQLIRREKKFIKVDKGGEEECAKEGKPVQSELHCNICKTTMTCSEQMTSHLNGKRHLSKEKQHIIRVMNGDIQETDGGQAEPAAEDPSEDKAASKGDDDWENGSGAWE